MNSLQSAIYGKGGATPDNGWDGWHGWRAGNESNYKAQSALGIPLATNRPWSKIVQPKNVVQPVSMSWASPVPSPVPSPVAAPHVARAETSSMKSALSSRPALATRFNRPGLLMTAIGAGTAGAVMGNGDASSFAIGAAAGIGGGYLAEGVAKLAHSRFQTMAKSGAEMSARASKAVNLGRMMTGKSGRAALFASGALMAGGMFGSMFADSRPSYRSGFNANRGSR